MTQQPLSLSQISPDLAFSVLDKELKERTLQDHDNIATLPNNALYIGFYIGDYLIGFTSIKAINRHVMEVHINIKKKYRGYAYIFSNKILSNLFSDPEINRIESSIPDVRKDVLIIVHKLGFIIEGVKRQSFLKDGEWHNLNIIGLLREDYGKR